MFKVIKMGFIYVVSIALAGFLAFVINFADKVDLKPKDVYKVYLDGKQIGNIKHILFWNGKKIKK